MEQVVERGDYERTEAVFGGREKEVGPEEGREGCGHSEWLGQDIRVWWGQEDEFSS